MIDPLLSSADAHNLLCCSLLGLKILMWPHWQWFKSDWNLWHSAHIYPAGKRAVPCSVLVQKPEGFPYGRVSLEPWEKKGKLKDQKKAKFLWSEGNRFFVCFLLATRTLLFFWSFFLSFQSQIHWTTRGNALSLWPNTEERGCPNFFAKTWPTVQNLSREAPYKKGVAIQVYEVHK